MSPWWHLSRLRGCIAFPVQATNHETLSKPDAWLSFCLTIVKIDKTYVTRADIFGNIVTFAVGQVLWPGILGVPPRAGSAQGSARQPPGLILFR